MKRFTIYLINGTDITIRAVDYNYSEHTLNFRGEDGKDVALFNLDAIAGWVTEP